jgi:2-dehydropantoate 2-reductase
VPKDLTAKIEKEILGYTNYSSMYQDIMKGKKTEIDFLNGKIVELGAKHSIPTPVNETLVHFIEFLEEKNELSRSN